MVTRVYFKNFNQRINVITALKSHLSESIMTFWKLLTTTNLLFCYCLTYRLHLILSITRFWYLDWRNVSALGTLLLIGFVYIFSNVRRLTFVSVNGIDSSLKGPCEHARNLGVGLDHYYDFSEQVYMTCMIAFSAFVVLPRLGDIYPWHCHCSSLHNLTFRLL